MTEQVPARVHPEIVQAQLLAKGLTEKQSEFVMYYVESGNIRHACRQTGVHHSYGQALVRQEKIQDAIWAIQESRKRVIGPVALNALLDLMEHSGDDRVRAGVAKTLWEIAHGQAEQKRTITKRSMSAEEAQAEREELLRDLGLKPVVDVTPIHGASPRTEGVEDAEFETGSEGEGPEGRDPVGDSDRPDGPGVV